MTLPASGKISIANFNTELGQVSNYAGSLAWIHDNTKSGQRSYAMNGYYSKAYYQRNMDGNCNNGNCAESNCNCGPFQCVNCLNCTTVNCANCDTRAWLQNNCNCACTYNCNSLGAVVTVNCNCGACDCKSDDKLKIRLKNIPNALEKVNALSGFYYQYNNLAQEKYNLSNKTEIGVSAQSVQEVAPELVSVDGEHLSVDYARLAPLLIESIKELTAMVNSLTNKTQPPEK